MGALLLTISLCFSVIGNFMVKLSKGFQNKLPSIGVFVSFSLCIYFLTLSVQYMEVGIVYAIWSGVSVAATTSLGILFFQEPSSRKKITSILVIIVGVVLLQFYS
ncbi:DMT family transporter [Salsuginibacillus kocurii]|uniref:DMT family transporter n=1 Tax=Salsuginibacillus kocurii TaxID=427078 RepID=UPI00035FF166|nr:multidrug efflux SMR transporter [Salsuginibacillus kocurii]